MVVEERVQEAKEFLELHYLAELPREKRQSHNFLVIDFMLLARFSIELSSMLLDDYGEGQKIFEIATGRFDGVKGCKVRFKNLPEAQHRLVWKLRKEDIGQLISVKGFIRKVSEVLHGVSIIWWECPACGNPLPVLQGKTISKPTKCLCGRERGFRITRREMYDIQRVVVEEDPADLENSIQKPRRIVAVLKDDLCREEIDKILQPSYKVKVTGLLGDSSITKEATTFKKHIDVEHIEVLNETYETAKFTQEEIDKFNELSKSGTFYDDMIQSIFPTIYGHSSAKLAIFLQLIGGVHIYNSEGLFEERGTIHVLLCGSPGSGKTQILRRAILFLPNSRFTGGRGASGIGLVAAVVKDEELGGYSLEAGAMPMANKSMLAIDELDKIDKTDISHMNNAMVDLKVSIDKANIHGVLETDTIVLGAANPTDRIFDSRELIWKQIGLPKDFMDRFDLIFPIENIRTEEGQRKVADVIFSKYMKTEASKPKLPVAFVKKYISYARQNYSPELNDIVKEFITDNFINLVKPSPHVDAEDRAYFSTRLLTNIIRLATATAKARLSNRVTVDDAKIAIDILIDSLKQQQIITTDGLLDIEKSEAIMPKRKRDAKYVIIEIIKDLCTQSQDKLASDSDVLRTAIQTYGLEESLVDEIIKKLVFTGDISEPKVCKYHV